ncbi:MAG TPA: FISUMP domain-containing protein [Bacteroidales bacterium]|nr:FISUMP domain-containing protein [Bacteroidales bacterium]
MKKTILLFTVLTLMTFISNAQPTINDYDGNVYNTVQIGNQLWMRENLKVTHYQNGDAIPIISATNLWMSATTHGRCYYNLDSASNKAVYGGLYNWHVVNDSRNVCPNGWHVPSDADWNTMEVALGSETISIGGSMKETGFAHWITPNTGATNSSGFTALPGGQRDYNGMFNNMTNYGYFWTSTTGTLNSVIIRYLTYSDVNLHIDEFSPVSGFSIRCVCNVLVTDVNDNNLNQIDIYPNPVSDKFYIDVAERQGLKMQLYNVVGACVLQRELNNTKEEINISNLAAGMYIIKVTGAGLTVQEKIIKE